MAAVYPDGLAQVGDRFHCPRQDQPLPFPPGIRVHHLSTHTGTITEPKKYCVDPELYIPIYCVECNAGRVRLPRQEVSRG